MDGKREIGNTIKYEEFIKLPDGAISTGYITDSEDGVLVDNSKQLLFYVVAKYSNQDWAVFTLNAATLKGMYHEDKVQHTVNIGIKAANRKYIKRVFNCSKKVLDLYITTLNDI